MYVWPSVAGLPVGVDDADTDLANYIYDRPGALDLDLTGIWIADRESACSTCFLFLTHSLCRSAGRLVVRPAANSRGRLRAQV